MCADGTIHYTLLYNCTDVWSSSPATDAFIYDSMPIYLPSFARIHFAQRPLLRKVGGKFSEKIQELFEYSIDINSHRFPPILCKTLREHTHRERISGENIFKSRSVIYTCNIHSPWLTLSHRVPWPPIFKADSCLGLLVSMVWPRWRAMAVYLL